MSFSLYPFTLIMTVFSCCRSTAVSSDHVLLGSCAAQPCLHGVCSDTSIGGHLCFCQNGFTGLSCQTNYDDCRSKPCVNGGTCLDGTDTFTCVCAQGYTGAVCETDINECSSDPCLNDGICQDLLNDYICHCTLGFFGQNCEMYFNVCATETVLCKNQGICMLGPGNTSSCSCPLSFFGVYCELSSCPCVRGGICIEDTDFSCSCPFGYTGKTCETEVETCDSAICNGGLCLAEENRTVCFCVPDFHGKFCENQYNECMPETCQNGATCVDDVDGFSCVCPVGFIGSNCSESYPCAEGSCISQPPLILPSYSIPSSHPGEPSAAFHSMDLQLSSVSIHSSDFDRGNSLLNPVSLTWGLPFPSVPEFTLSFARTADAYSPSEAYSRQNENQMNQCPSLDCQNGGTPVFNLVEKNEECQCVCPLLFAGPHCERETFLLVPQFHQSSYLLHLLAPGKGLNIDLTLKVLSPDGILFFIQDVHKEAFLLLHVENGVLKLRFSCGQQTTVFMGTQNLTNSSYFTTVSVILSLEHDIPPVRKAFCNVKLLVNGSSPMSGQQFSPYPHLDFRRLFIGGFPRHMQTINPSIHKIPWFGGCMVSLQVGGEEKELVGDAEAGVGITECYSSACYRDPCRNGATCKSYDDHWNCACPVGFTGPFCEHKTCFANPCEHGSTCLPDSDNGYLCICPYGKHGKNCELDLLISVPSFHGDVFGYSSYLQYLLQSDHHYHLELRFVFATPRPSQKALLLFNGQTDSTYLIRDFIAVALHSGYIWAMFNLGSGTRVLKTSYPLSKMLAFHTVLIGRHRRYCWVEVDTSPRIVGIASGPLTALNTPSAVHIGGHSSYNFSLLPEELSIFKGFEGCSFGVEYRTSPGAVFQALQPIAEGRNIQQCSTSECQLIQCANGGTCIDVGSTFRCECKEGWRGALCSQKITPCSEGTHKCGEGSACVPLEDGYRCNCPLGRSGAYCEKNISVSDPLFDGSSSFLSQPSVDVRHSMDVVLSIRPLSKDGLLFYAAQHLNELSRDFVSLLLVAGLVQLRINLGTDPSSTIVLSSYKEVNNDTWQQIEFGRYKRIAYLKLEEDEEVSSVSPQGMEMLDIGTHFFLGGIPDLSALPKQSFDTVPAYYRGCIRLFSVNSKVMDLNSKDDNSLSGINIKDCDGTSCGFDTCKNGASCIPKEEGFQCLCSNSFRGATCEVPEQCWQNKCLHGSSCVLDSSSGYRCICSIGWQGDYCEKRVPLSSAFFSGYSYFLYKENPYKYSNVTRTNISFMYLTDQSSGLLMWTGKASSGESDFLGVGLNSHHLHLVWSLGWLSRNEIITKPIESGDKVWHTVHIERYEKTLSLRIDDKSYSSTVSGTFYELNTDGMYYFGGFSRGMNIEDTTLGYFSTPFVGCMKNFSIAGKMVNLMDVEMGQNLAQCSQG